MSENVEFVIKTAATYTDSLGRRIVENEIVYGTPPENWSKFSGEAMLQVVFDETGSTQIYPISFFIPVSENEGLMDAYGKFDARAVVATEEAKREIASEMRSRDLLAPLQQLRNATGSPKIQV